MLGAKGETTIDAELDACLGAQIAQAIAVLNREQPSFRGGTASPRAEGEVTTANTALKCSAMATVRCVVCTAPAMNRANRASVTAPRRGTLCLTQLCESGPQNIIAAEVAAPTTGGAALQQGDIRGSLLVERKKWCWRRVYSKESALLEKAPHCDAKHRTG